MEALLKLILIRKKGKLKSEVVWLTY